ncbi:hypothetical protein 2011_scaffold13_00048 [Bacteriophage sp.]|nr:hypothetical protein 2011_scaffold13_00048 [Bacteriophage sp.]
MYSCRTLFSHNASLSFLLASVSLFRSLSILPFTCPMKSAIIRIVSLQNSSLMIYSSCVYSWRKASIRLLNSFLFLMSILHLLESVLLVCIRVFLPIYLTDKHSIRSTPDSSVLAFIDHVVLSWRFRVLADRYHFNDFPFEMSVGFSNLHTSIFSYWVFVVEILLALRQIAIFIVQRIFICPVQYISLFDVYVLSERVIQMPQFLPYPGCFIFSIRIHQVTAYLKNLSVHNFLPFLQILLIALSSFALPECFFFHSLRYSNCS